MATSVSPWDFPLTYQDELPVWADLFALAVRPREEAALRWLAEMKRWPRQRFSLYEWEVYDVIPPMLPTPIAADKPPASVLFDICTGLRVTPNSTGGRIRRYPTRALAFLDAVHHMVAYGLPRHPDQGTP